MLNLSILRRALTHSRWMAAPLMAAALCAAPLSHASDWTPILGGGAGAAAGAVLGQSVGGKNGAVIGGAIGGATGAAVTSPGRNQSGAMIGGAVGGAAGAAVGQSVGGRSGAVVGAGIGGAAGTGIARGMNDHAQAERYAHGGPRHPGYQTGYRDDDRGYRKGLGHHKPHHGHRGKGRGHDRFRD
ncbi:hypothetical protein MCEMSHM24_01996 [Comamonadaceae bacterium]